jgi:hypothetical protein
VLGRIHIPVGLPLSSIDPESIEGVNPDGV